MRMLGGGAFFTLDMAPGHVRTNRVERLLDRAERCGSVVTIIDNSLGGVREIDLDDYGRLVSDWASVIPAEFEEALFTTKRAISANATESMGASYAPRMLTKRWPQYAALAPR